MQERQGSRNVDHQVFREFPRMLISGANLVWCGKTGVTMATNVTDSGPATAINGGRREEILRLARGMFMRQQRLDVGDIASRLGVSRITVYRHMGNREQLVSEVLWSLSRATLERARRDSAETGEVEFLPIYRRYNSYLGTSPAFLHFLREESAFALKLLTRPDGTVRVRLMVALQQLLDEDIELRGHRFHLDTATLAYVIVCIGESYLYPLIAMHDDPDLDRATEVVRLLLRP